MNIHAPNSENYDLVSCGNIKFAVARYSDQPLTGKLCRIELYVGELVKYVKKWMEPVPKGRFPSIFTMLTYKTLQFEIAFYGPISFKTAKKTSWL